MKRAQKFTSVVGTLALFLGMTAGIATAQVSTSNELPVSIEVECTMPNTVTLTGGGAFETYDIATGDGTADLLAPIGLTVDVGCYFGPWHVNAQIEAFDGPGAAFIPGNFFSMADVPGSVVSPWPVGPNPVTSDANFIPAGGGDGMSPGAIFETYNVFVNLPWPFPDIDFDVPAPFVSSASYTGALDSLDTILLVEGTYTSELTVELYLD